MNLSQLRKHREKNFNSGRVGDQMLGACEEVCSCDECWGACNGGYGGECGECFMCEDISCAGTERKENEIDFADIYEVITGRNYYGW